MEGYRQELSGRSSLKKPKRLKEVRRVWTEGM